MSKERVIVCHLGHIAYEPAWELQKKVQAALIRAKREDPPRRVDHVLLFVEHPPVYTLGKSGKANHLLVSETELADRGAAFFHIDRGGDITFHGPGQLVGYPIFDLDRLNPDVHLYMRNLEEVIRHTCLEYGLDAGRVEGKTGVWLPAQPGKPTARKVCAMGIRCSRWVTMHGFALNVNTDLSFFSHIVPCGITDGTVTSLKNELEHTVDMDEVMNRVTRYFAEVFDVDTRIVSDKQAMEFLEEFIGEQVASV